MGRMTMVTPSLRPEPDVLDMLAVSSSLANAALSDGPQELRRIAADVRRHVRGIERDLADYKRTMGPLPQLVAEATDENLDLALSTMLLRERALKEAWAQTGTLCRKLEARARHERPATLPVVHQITNAALRWYRPYLLFLRDLRWEIMALQADAAPDATGPILADPSDVDAYIRSLPPAA
jgi:hypothetical protein